MVIDASAVLAVLFGEPEAASFIRAIKAAPRRRMSAAGYVEAGLVVDARGDAVASREFDRFLRRARITVEPLSYEQAQIARRAYQDFGNGKHPAGLNFGDCMAYALAKWLDEPLLFKGDDFGKTDVQVAGVEPR